MSLHVKISIRRIISFLLFISTFTLLAHAQEPSTRKDIYFWMSPGIGLGNMGESRELAFRFGIGFQIGHLIITARNAGVTEVMSTSIDEDVVDLGLTAGYSTKTPGSDGYVSISGGVSYVRGTRGYLDEISTVGLPIEVHLFVTPLSFAGIGLQFFGNINPERSFYGMLLCLQLGKVR
jgi:hypothetical protein